MNILKVFLILIFVFHAFDGSFLLSQKQEDVLIQDVIGNVQKYKKKILTLKLKLKMFDKVFEKIVFYDRKNQDIEFDISQKHIKKKIEADMLNLHEGMDYLVTFTVNGVGNLGGLIADLHGFKPVIMKIIP
ncbi:hypothetical protein ACFL20_00535 [Spirochaetota bacterium]